MSGDDMHKELEQLRAEVAALSSARASKQAADTQPKTSPDEQQPTGSDEVNNIIENAQAAVAADADLTGQFDQLFEHLEQEIKDLPAITTLAVFSLGVLFGRLLR
jgi:cell division septum initiation protein DivIVA